MRKLLVTVAAMAFVAPAFAQDAPDFATADADGSGTVSQEEAMAAMPDMAEEDFTAADADGSGDLDEDEFGTLADGGTMDDGGEGADE